jgi:hypothetical protein
LERREEELKPTEHTTPARAQENDQGQYQSNYTRLLEALFKATRIRRTHDDIHALTPIKRRTRRIRQERDNGSDSIKSYKKINHLVLECLKCIF